MFCDLRCNSFKFPAGGKLISFDRMIYFHHQECTQQYLHCVEPIAINIFISFTRWRRQFNYNSCAYLFGLGAWFNHFRIHKHTCGEGRKTTLLTSSLRGEGANLWIFIQVSIKFIIKQQYCFVTLWKFHEYKKTDFAKNDYVIFSLHT